MNDDAEKKTSSNGRDDAGRFAAGGPGGPGRPAGVPNKITASVRDLVRQSIDERNPAGALAWLNSLPDSLFVRLAERLLPRDQHLEVGGDVQQIPIQIISWADAKKDDADDDDTIST